MVSIDATAEAREGIALVTATIEGGPVPTRVEVRNRLDGPVWPPRRAGEPVDGWSDDGYEAVVPAGERVALGYACPAEPTDSPLEIVATERTGPDEGGDFDSPSAVLRGLGSPAPPGDAVPLPAPNGDEPEWDESELDDGKRTDRAADDREADRHTTVGVANESSSDGQDAPDEAPRVSDVTLPDPVARWLADAEARIERAEALADASDVPAATDAVRAVGSIDAVRSLEGRRSADADRLREVARCANALAYRAESADVPLEALERLA